MLLVNMAKCLKCGDVLISHHRHDFVECSCGAFAVDGGVDYTRRLGTPLDYLELSLTEDSPFEEIRKYLCRGSRGVSGEEPLKWIPLCDTDDCYLNNLIQFKINEQQTQDIRYLMYLKEAVFRLECDKVS